MGRDERANLRGMPGGLPIIGAGGTRILKEPPEVRDVFNRPVGVGDLCQINTGTIHSFMITEVKPVVESGLPEGLMEITFHATLKFRCPRAQPQQEFTRVLTDAEVKAARQPAGGASAQGDGDPGEPSE